ncbi:pyridoxal phosphate-dependent transferase, partial [Mycena polygramma]
ALQYGMSSGLPQLQKIVKEFSDKVYTPGYENYQILLHAGNTDAWNKVVTTLCNPGEGVLVSKWTYPSAMASMKPYNIKPVPIEIDGEGMRSDALRTVLTEWDETARGMPRPRVIYAVPIGENPTGTNSGAVNNVHIVLSRGSLCFQVEDDPYFILQEGPYVPKSHRTSQSQSPRGSGLDEEAQFIASLEPSYLKFDYQGRVTIAPGCRLGWYTCNPMFVERLERASETSTQAPCGFGQSLVTATLLEWGYEGYIRWLKGTVTTPNHANLMFCFKASVCSIRCAATSLSTGGGFQLAVTAGTSGMFEGCQVYHGFAKPKRSLTRYYNEKTPTIGNALVCSPYVWDVCLELAEDGVLVWPWCHVSPTQDWSSERSGHFRISVSMLENDDMKKAVTIFGGVIRKFMGV